MVITRTYTEPMIDKKEILRYAGCKNSTGESLQFSDKNIDGNIEILLEEALQEVLPKLSYKVCYMEFPLSITESECDLGCLQIVSKDLVKNLCGCGSVILFAATIGVEIDRLILKYAAVSPAKAVMLQAIGAERIEALCDRFCEEMKAMESERVRFHPRFSPGYGDLPLQTQTDIFRLLNCGKYIGVSLNESLLMSPTKSVTAFVGKEKEE